MQPPLKRAIRISGLTMRQKIYIRIFQRMRPAALIRLMAVSQKAYDLVLRYVNSPSLAFLGREEHQLEDFRAWCGLFVVVAISPRASLMLPRFFSTTYVMDSGQDPHFYISMLMDAVSALLIRSKTFLSKLCCNLDLVCDHLAPRFEELNLISLTLYKPYHEIDYQHYCRLGELLSTSQPVSPYLWPANPMLSQRIKVQDDVFTEVLHMYPNLAALTIPTRVIDLVIPGSLEMQVLDEDCANNLTSLSTILIVRAGDLEHERILSLSCQFYSQLLSLALDLEPFPGLSSLFLEHQGLQHLTLYSSSGLVKCPLLKLPALKKITLELSLSEEGPGTEASAGVFMQKAALISLLLNSPCIAYINTVYSDHITREDITENLGRLVYTSLTFLRLRFFLLGSEELSRRGITSDAAARLVHRMPRLRKLTMSGFRDMLCDSHMACILRSCPDLEELSLTGRHDVLPNVKAYVCNCESQILCPTSENPSLFDNSDGRTDVYPALSVSTSSSRHRLKNISHALSTTSVHEYHHEQMPVTNPESWVPAMEEPQGDAKTHSVSHLSVLKLKQIYITDRTFINLYILGAGNTIRILWLDDLPRISSIGVTLLTNQVLLYGPLLTGAARLVPTQPADYPDQPYTILTRKALDAHNESYIRRYTVHSDVITLGTETTESTSSYLVTDTVEETCIILSESVSNQNSQSQQTKSHHTVAAETEDRLRITDAPLPDEHKGGICHSAENLQDKVALNLTKWLADQKGIDRHVANVHNIIKAAKEDSAIHKLSDRSFSDSYLPAYHLPRYPFTTGDEHGCNSQHTCECCDLEYDYSLRDDFNLMFSGFLAQGGLDHMYSMPSQLSFVVSQECKQEVNDQSGLNKRPDHANQANSSQISLEPCSRVRVRVPSEPGHPSNPFVMFRNRILPRFIEYSLDAESCLARRLIHSLFSDHGIYHRSLVDIINVANGTGRQGGENQYKLVYSSLLQKTYEAANSSLFTAADFSVANATLVAPTYRYPRDKAMPVPVELLKWILSEYAEPSVLEKVSIANCALIDSSVVTGLATSTTQDLYSIQLKLLYPIHHSAYYTVVSQHAHSLQYLYLLPFASEAENAEFLKTIKTMCSTLTVNIDWKTERSHIFV